MTRENFQCDQMLDLVLHPYALLVFSQSHQFHSPILLLWHLLMMIPLHYRKKMVIWWLFYGEIMVKIMVKILVGMVVVIVYLMVIVTKYSW